MKSGRRPDSFDPIIVDHAELPQRTLDYQARRAARLEALRQQFHERLLSPRRITLEVGCGHGHFLTAYAQAHPEELCLGIDLILDRIHRAGRKQARAAAPHLHFIRAEAREFLASLAPEVRFDRFFILFPDPWPKRRHHKNRLIQPSILAALAQRARSHAELCFRTDHEDYFRDALHTFSEDPYWQIDKTHPWPFEFETVFQAKATSFQSVVATLKNPSTPP